METKIRQLIKEAMIHKNENAKTTYKNILDNAFKIAKNDRNRAVTNDDFIKAAKNEVKQLNDLYEYVKNDVVRTTEIKEKLKYCEAILPKMVTAEEITEYLTSNIEKNIGVCMKSLKTKFGNTLDGKMAQTVVRQYIGN